MTDDSWEEVEGIISAAVEAGPSARAAILASHCAGRPALRAEVESLLAALLEAGAFLDTPPAPAGTAILDVVAEDGPSIGTRIGPYRMVEVIGEGGAGQVFRAERADGEFDHQVAIKILHVAGTTEVRRFRAERQALAALQHPHIVALLDGGTLPGGYAYLVMECVRGTAITSYCREHQLSLERRLRLFHDVALAVHHAHEQHVVHRDIKPSNVLVTADGTPKVVDFGIAKLLDESAAAALGATIQGLNNPLTPNYASPEQLRGLPVTPASDVYALGVLLYEIVTGVRPYETAGKPLDEVLDLVLKEGRTAPSEARVSGDASPPYPLDRLRPGLDDIVLRAMARVPADRYPSVQALAADVMACLEGRLCLAAGLRFSTWPRRAVAALACGLLLLAAGGDSGRSGLARAAATGPHAAGRTAPPRPGGTTNAEAREAYERGLRIFRTRTDLATAIQAFRQALGHDPRFALAHVGLANAYAVQVSPSPDAERHVAEAFRLSPDLGQAHATRGFIRMFHYWDWLGAEDALRRATALAPEHAQAHHWLGYYLMLMRRYEEARQSFEHAARLDPASPPILADLGLLAYYTGDDERAERYCEQARDAEGDDYSVSAGCLARVYERRGRYREAWMLDEWGLGSARNSAPGGPQALEADTRLWMGKIVPYLRGETVGIELLNPNTMYRLAVAYARLGDKPNAVQQLRNALSRRAFLTPLANVEPVFDGLRSETTFKEILSKMGLPAR